MELKTRAMEQDMEEADMVDHQDTVRIEDTEITAVITVPEIVKEKDTEKEIVVLVREIITESVVGAERGTRSTGNITRTGTDTGRGTGTEKGREEMTEIEILALPRPE